jgi:hypothetical protein
MSKITAYTALTAVTAGDLLPIVDISDTTMAATGTTKKIAASDLLALGVQVDSTAADFQVDGVASAGTSGLAARADHVHPFAGWLSVYQAFSAATAETYPRILVTTSTTGVSGTLYLTAVGLPKGLVVGNLTFGCKGTGAATVTHGWYVLADSGLVVRAVTADSTTLLASANTLTTLPVTAAYTVPSSGLYYLGCMVAATTMPVMGTAGNIPGAWASNTPILCGSSNTGATTPPAVGATLTALTANGNFTQYAYTS